MSECQDYHVIDEALTDGDIPITIYQNKITGLRVVTADVQCPMVKADLTFATEAFDDDGLPHTLEHLVFLGSENYPHRGTLDLLANRCLADGTNACTDTDYTNYTVTTAGSEGLLNLLPVFLDCLLFPTFGEAEYITEVHHINAEGEDAGIVYCEMQGRENTGDSRCHLEMMRSMYPGKCGFSSETGGILHNLRTSTSHEKCRNYHKKFYNSKNLCIVVTGPCKAEDIFKAIRPIEEKIVTRGLHQIDFERPWQSKVEPLESSVCRSIEYSSDTDDDGLVYLGFRGPNVVENFKELMGISLLLEYLNETSISPIQRDFVESDEPYCSCVSHDIIEHSISCFYLIFESVGKEYADDVKSKLLDLLRNIQSGKERFDMDRMQTIMSRKKVRLLSAAETSPHSIVINPVMGHFLYGVGKLEERAREIPLIEEMTKHTEEYWRGLIEKYMTGEGARHVCIVGKPSPELMKLMTKEESERLRRQKESLKDELPRIAERLKLLESSVQRPPEEVTRSLPIPSPDNIVLHSIERFVVDESKSPIRIHYDSIKTNFVGINLLMDSSNCLTKQERLYLPLLIELLLESPIERATKEGEAGDLVPYEQVVSELFSDTVTYTARIGVSSSSANCVGSFSTLVSVGLQVEIHKYERAVKWFHELLYRTVFDVARIKTVATRLASDISQYKRSAGKVLTATTKTLIYKQDSNQWASNFMRQGRFLAKLLKELKENPHQVQKQITHIRDQLTQAKNMFVHITLNKKLIDVNRIHEPWSNGFLPSSLPASHLKFEDILPCHKLVEPLPEPKAALVGVGSDESNHLQRFVKSINSLEHPDLAPVYVLLSYLTQLEGPLWRGIRGLGLSYNYALYLSPADGLLHLQFYKSAQLVGAFREIKTIIEKYSTGESKFEDSLLESAKATLIHEFIKREKSPACKSSQSLVAYLRNLPIDFNKHLIKQVSQVSREDLIRVLDTHLRPLFDETGPSRTVVCCHPSKWEQTEKAFEESGCSLVRVDLDKAQFLNAID